MKRKWPTDAKSQRGADLRKNFTTEQLQAIGAVTIAWNEAEIILDIALGEGLDLAAAMWFEVSTRINGFDGKIAIIRKFPEIWGLRLGQDTFRLIERSIVALMECKKYRDAVIHARAYDAPGGIGELIRRQATKEQVLLTVEALNGLFDRLVFLRDELICIAMLFSTVRYGDYYDAQGKQCTEQSTQVYIVQLQQHQTGRQSLPPLPAFPKSPPIPEAMEDSTPTDQT